jgi:hypothetical protein
MGCNIKARPRLRCKYLFILPLLFNALGAEASLYRIHYIMDLENADLVVFGIGTGSTSPYLDAFSWATLEVQPMYWDEPTGGPGGLSYWIWEPLDPYGDGELWQEALFECTDEYVYHLYTSHRAQETGNSYFTYLFPDQYTIDDTIDNCNDDE